MSEPSRWRLWGATTGGASAALLATATSACCVPILAPLLVSALGVSGAVWAAGLHPYSLYILAASGAFLAYGFWSVLRPRKVAEGESCPRRRPLGVLAILWLSTALWLLALTLNVIEHLALTLALTLTLALR